LPAKPKIQLRSNVDGQSIGEHNDGNQGEFPNQIVLKKGGKETERKLSGATKRNKRSARNNREETAKRAGRVS